MQAKQNDLTIFVEKDPAAIAVAEGEFIPESLSYRLISYNHYSMKGNLAEKKTTLLDLANLLEPQRTILERIDKTFSSDLFYTLNKLPSVNHMDYASFTLHFEDTTQRKWRVPGRAEFKSGTWELSWEKPQKI